MKYRSRSEIVAIILEAANGGTTRTRIMYKAFSSFRNKEYLSMLLEKGLIEYEEGTRRYKTTEKGIRMQQVYNQINDELVISPSGQLQR